MISSSALSAIPESFLVISSMLTVSCEGIAWPALSRGAPWVPVVIEIAGLLIKLTDPSFATDFSFSGVPSLTSRRISICVGSSLHALTPLTLPTLIPPNRTSDPGSTPPA